MEKEIKCPMPGCGGKLDWHPDNQMEPLVGGYACPDCSLSAGPHSVSRIRAAFAKQEAEIERTWGFFLRSSRRERQLAEMVSKLMDRIRELESQADLIVAMHRNGLLTSSEPETLACAVQHIQETINVDRTEEE